MTTAGRTARYTISDRRAQFRGVYRAWCERSGTRPRFGAVYRHGSIAIIERFWGSLQRECLRRLVVPASAPLFGRELRTYAEWYNLHRPHRALGGRTPHEVRFAKKPAIEKRGVEARLRMPIARGGPKRVRRLELVVAQRLGSAELPVLRLKHAA